MFEIVAEFIQVEGKGAAHAVSHGHLKIVVDVFIHFPDIVLVGECVTDTLVEGGFITLGV